MSFAALVAEDRRLVLLRCLTEVPGYEANEAVLRTGLDHFGHRVTSDVLRADLQFLEKERLVAIDRLQKPGGELWIAKLSGTGREVADGDRVVAGVKRREPGE